MGEDRKGKKKYLNDVPTKSPLAGGKPDHATKLAQAKLQNFQEVTKSQNYQTGFVLQYSISSDPEARGKNVLQVQA